MRDRVVASARSARSFLRRRSSPHLVALLPAPEALKLFLRSLSTSTFVTLLQARKALFCFCLKARALRPLNCCQRRRRWVGYERPRHDDRTMFVASAKGAGLVMRWRCARGVDSVLASAGGAGWLRAADFTRALSVLLLAPKALGWLCPEYSASWMEELLPAPEALGRSYDFS